MQKKKITGIIPYQKMINFTFNPWLKRRQFFYALPYHLRTGSRANIIQWNFVWICSFFSIIIIFLFWKKFSFAFLAMFVREEIWNHTEEIRPVEEHNWYNYVQYCVENRHPYALFYVKATVNWVPFIFFSPPPSPIAMIFKSASRAERESLSDTVTNYTWV